jgi:lactate racemase
MPQFQLPYGDTSVLVDLPEYHEVDLIEPAYCPPAPDPIQVVRDSLEHPVDGIGLDAYRGARRVAIAINDKTRPVPHEHMLPPLLEKLADLGIPDQAITLMVATGTHTPMPAAEFERIVPPAICHKYRIVSHDIDDASNMLQLGVTSRGSQVWVNQRFYESDLKIVLGNIEPHHFAGFSGGYKTAAIGLGGRATINHNHAMLVEPDSRIAEFTRNPLRQDIEEMGDQIVVHFALNVVMNSDKKIVAAVSGSPRAVMQAGIPISQRVCQTPIHEKYDLVIASVGGAPKDINFYQSEKAATHASLFTRDGGVIVLVAACPEGSGSQGYEQFMDGVGSVQEVFNKFKQVGFQVGPHKAFQVARHLARVKLVLLSQISPELVKRLLMIPVQDIDEAMDLSRTLLGVPPGLALRVAVLPHATNTVPV